ncbi:sarcosine oxidase subunit gamma [Primorskyibacter sp. 2E233]|uniref:sarcosine oxidase subunit gamma n=1 Tax=Primorskyibacter sp. 2E233 TaxID=3413431 RepID=UPI003BF3621A
MSEPVSPLKNASYDGLVQIQEVGPLGMITLRGDLASSDIKNAATGVAGVDMPKQRGANCVDERGILWMSPDELLVLCPYGEAAVASQTMTSLLSGSHALAVNVSDARAVFHITGDKTREVLAKLSPADLSPEALPVGELRRTRLAQVAAAFWMRSETHAQVICFRSVADYVFDLLKTAAHPASAVYHD